MVEETLIQMNLGVETEDGDPYEQARAMCQLRDEIKGLGEEEVALVTQDSPPESTRSIDPMIIGAVVVAIGPAVLPKFLEFLHAWAMRHEGRTVKISIKRQRGDSIELEVPYTMSLPEAKEWIATIQDTISTARR
jgi:hypothetical protein